MLPGHERTKIDEPMDTIFVKQVRANSPAAEAGLRTGDRVVSVDGTPTRGEQYASVVQRIQQAGPWLRLLVVSKEDDILQRVREIALGSIRFYLLLPDRFRVGGHFFYRCSSTRFHKREIRLDVTQEAMNEVSVNFQHFDETFCAVLFKWESA